MLLIPDGTRMRRISIGGSEDSWKCYKISFNNAVRVRKLRAVREKYFQIFASEFVFPYILNTSLRIGLFPTRFFLCHVRSSRENSCSTSSYQQQMRRTFPIRVSSTIDSFFKNLKNHAPLIFWSHFSVHKKQKRSRNVWSKTNLYCSQRIICRSYNRLGQTQARLFGLLSSQNQ